MVNEGVERARRLGLRTGSVNELWVSGAGHSPSPPAPGPGSQSPHLEEGSVAPNQ